MNTEDAFYERYLAPLESRMLRTIWRIVRDLETARDALQEALAAIWRRRDAVRSHPNPEALILRICINTAYDALRKLHRYRRFEESDIDTTQCVDEKAGSVQDAHAGPMGREVLAAIRRLTRNQAAAILMRAVQDQPYPAIAQALGCSEPTARIHVMRARARLSRWLSHLSPLQVQKGRPR